MNDISISKERRDAIRAAAEKATPGPWGVWTEPTPSKDRAIDELAYQVMSTPDADFAEAVYLLNAAGECPATTGCGPTSAANAAHIANCDPQTILALLDALDAAEKAEPAAVKPLEWGGGDMPLRDRELRAIVDALAASPEAK